MVTLNTKTDTKANLFLLYYVSLEYQPQMVSGFLNYTSVLSNSEITFCPIPLLFYLQ
jgi:hypothetical protein